MEGGPSVITYLTGAFRLHNTCHRIASVVFGFPAKVSWPNIASLPRNVSSSSKQIPSEVNDFPIPIAFSRHCGRRHAPTPPIYMPVYTPACNQNFFSIMLIVHLIRRYMILTLISSYQSFLRLFSRCLIGL